MLVSVKTDLQRYDILRYALRSDVKKKLKIIQPFGRKIVSLRLDIFLQ